MFPRSIPYLYLKIFQYLDKLNKMTLRVKHVFISSHLTILPEEEEISKKKTQLTIPQDFNFPFFEELLHKLDISSVHQGRVTRSITL